eukprot:TRINITY_DN11082_c0_g1_i1.p1 TRINITY_DN11082_c0_g1~~TRINITY_DN11082_c0_g1_i1.p1  ORF type:complete len:322 (-),score=54.19 TRINITY_DN11082_c0_g1_i1:172-1137(-)
MARRESSPLLLRRQQQYVFPIDAQNRSHSPLLPPVSNLNNYLTTQSYFIENYAITPQVLGTGSFSEVRLGFCLQTSQRVAVKCMPRHKISAESWRKLERESLLLKRVGGHSNIVQLYDVIVTPTHVFQIFEFIQGEDLLDFLDKYERLPENILRDIFKQLLSAVQHCHNLNVVHMDLKLENVMIEHETGRVVLIDFGFAEEVDPLSPYLSQKCGSPHYCAPEIVTNAFYDPRMAEVWSLGVLLYILSCGHFPYDDEAVEPGHERVLVILQKIKTEALAFPDFLSEDLCCLIYSMLRIRPTERISLAAIQSLSWWRRESLHY